MGDGLKISKDKRHRSSSSLGGPLIEGTRSERKLEIRASIPEVDDQFAAADARCAELQEKIELVKALKRKKKLKKRSLTGMTSVPNGTDNIPMISVRTQPKKKVTPQTTRLRRIETPPNPTRGYLDPTTVEQHHMLGQIRGYNQHQPLEQLRRSNMDMNMRSPRASGRRARADGDTFSRSNRIVVEVPKEVACGEDESNLKSQFSENDLYDENRVEYISPGYKKSVKSRYKPRENVQKKASAHQKLVDDRPVVELFNKSRGDEGFGANSPARHKKVWEQHSDLETGHLENHRPRRMKYRSRRYEMPTVSSQMKQSGARCYYGTANTTNIPFVVSKSTAPSHNIGVNLQQVLNGLKIQQPLSGIPLTIAHHMGLRHQSFFSPTNKEPSLEQRDINVIKVGRRLLRLPSYKHMSYNRLLTLYREGEGMVPRFLRSISRPHYFYTSMYNLVANHEDFDGATSKGRGCTQDAKQSLAEYATLYREYEELEKRLQERPGAEPDTERRRDELARELAAREDHIRKVVQDYRASGDPTIRASASTADTNRHSTFKLNLGESQH